MLSHRAFADRAGKGSAAAVTIAIAVVDEQQDNDDKQQPRAVGLTAEQVSQAHDGSSSL